MIQGLGFRVSRDGSSPADRTFTNDAAVIARDLLSYVLLPIFSVGAPLHGRFVAALDSQYTSHLHRQSV